jgi:hypothetical protein
LATLVSLDFISSSVMVWEAHAMLENKILTGNVGKWDAIYRDLSVTTPLTYADAVTYLMAAAFLADVDEVEDWGCGVGGFRKFCISPRYVGLDGSKTPFADKIVDVHLSLDCRRDNNAAHP